MSESIFKKGTKITFNMHGCNKSRASNTFMTYASKDDISDYNEFPNGKKSITLSHNINICNENAAAGLALFLAQAHGLSPNFSAKKGLGWLDKEESKYFSFILE